MNEEKILNGKKQIRRPKSEYFYYSDDKEDESQRRLSFLSVSDNEVIKPRRKKVKREVKEQKNEVPYWKLYKFASSIDWIFIIFGILCTGVVGVCQIYYCVCFGVVTGNFIDYVNSNETKTGTETTSAEDKLYSDIFSFAMRSVGIGLATLICQYLAGISFSYSSLRQIFRIRQELLKKTLNQDVSWFDLNDTGDFATTFSENLGKIEEGLGGKVGIFLHFEIVVVCGIIWSLVLGWQLALVCLISLPLSTIVMKLITWLSTKLSKQELESYAKAGSIAEEVFTAIRTVLAFEGQNVEMKRYEKHLLDAKKNNIRRHFFSGLSNGFLWFLVYSCCALSMWYGVTMIINERNVPAEERTYTPDIVVAVFFNTLVASWHFNMATPYLQIFAIACGAASKVFKVLDAEVVINKSFKNGMKPKTLRGEIVFNNVHFKYPSRSETKILKGLSLKIEQGKSVALVGSSGCGKSTCIQLLQRFYDPTEGEIIVDGYDLKDMNLAWFRSKIGLVGQEPVLFATTIAENIRYGKLSANQEDIERAAKKAKVHAFIKSLPNGYQTIIGERGTQLSGGQKQRIAIARALVRKPYIILLDEATSALDSTSEAEVQSAIDSVSGDCTTITVAHRLSTVRNADKIFVLAEGEVVEQGTYMELMENKGFFFELVKSQGSSFAVKRDSEEIYMEPLKETTSRKDRKESFVELHKFKHRQSISGEHQQQKQCFLKILRMSKPEVYWIIVGCITSIIIGASLPIYSVLFGDMIGIFSIIDKVKLRRETNMISIYFLILGVVSGLAYIIQVYAFGIAGENLTFRVRSQMFFTLLKQEMGWFDKKENGVGALCTKLSTDSAYIQGASGMPIGTVLNSLSTLILANALAIYFQWKLALILLAFFPLIFISIYFEQKITQGDADFREKKLQNSASLAVEAIGNIRTVASLGCEKIFLERYVDQLTPYIISAKKKSHFNAFMMGVARSLMYFAYAAALSYGAKLIVTENVHYGTVFKVSELIIVGSWSLGNTFAFAPNFQSGLEAAARFFTLLGRIPEIRNVNNASKRNWDVGNIEYSDVYFSYPTRPDIPILRGLDLDVLAGKTVALVGASGCGKSTIIQLLERFYNCTAGEVCVDDVDIKIMDLQHVRSNFGLVSQEPNLFDRTIAENISYGNNQRHVPISDVIEAAKKANIHNFIVSLPNGYETRLGSKGTQLSGGQKQRIAIARALIRNPKVLLLDEATSALDSESEKLVQAALDKAKEGRTCITIAHRLTTIQDADLICVIDKGKIVEAGKHQELINKKQYYYDFYKSHGR